MSETRTFPTTTAEWYDRSLSRGLKLKPVPKPVKVPQPTSWWLSIGTVDSVIN